MAYKLILTKYGWFKNVESVDIVWYDTKFRYFPLFDPTTDALDLSQEVYGETMRSFNAKVRRVVYQHVPWGTPPPNAYTVAACYPNLRELVIHYDPLDKPMKDYKKYAFRYNNKRAMT